MDYKVCSSLIMIFIAEEKLINLESGVQDAGLCIYYRLGQYNKKKKACLACLYLESLI